MSKVKEDTKNFLQKFQQNQALFTHASPNNAAKGIFGHDLPQSVDNAINQLMVEHWEPIEGSSQPEELESDLKRLKEVTGSVRGIAKQGAFLIGQKIYEAREILKKYRNSERSFSKWLEITFDQSRRTAYNALSLYEFHEELEDIELQKRLKSIPQKAAYLLASRKGTLSKKMQILEKNYAQKADELIDLINTTFPLGEGDQRKQKKNSVVLKLNLTARYIQKKLEDLIIKKKYLTKDTILLLKKCHELINEIIFIEKSSDEDTL